MYLWLSGNKALNFVEGIKTMDLFGVGTLFSMLEIAVKPVPSLINQCCVYDNNGFLKNS